MSEVDAEESRHRFDYWLSFLCCCPIAMGILCEIVRICVISRMPNSDYRTVSRIPTESETESGTESETESGTVRTALSRTLQSKAQNHRFCAAFILYHIFCAGLVAVAVCNDWATIKGGGSFSWEFWAIWQQLCLWNLFVQNLLRCWRCWRVDPASLRQRTFQKTLLYTCPILSELADTLKDWIVTGICLKATPHFGGFVCGGILVAIDLLHRALCKAPRVFPCRLAKKKAMFPLFASMPGLLAIVWSALARDLTVLFVLSLILLTGICCRLRSGDCCAWVGCCAMFLSLTGLWFFHQHILHEPWLSRATAAIHQLWILSSDGGCLFCLSAYTIVVSHVLIASDRDAFFAVRKTYRAILSLPKRAPMTVQYPSWRSQISEYFSGFAVEFCSPARLLIAWLEDLPQGLIGFALVAAHQDQVGGIGFAGVAAVIGLAKGILIPTGQGLALAERQIRVNSCLEDMKGLRASLPPDFDVKDFHKMMLSMQEARTKANEAGQRLREMASKNLPKAEKEAAIDALSASLKKCQEALKISKGTFKAKWTLFNNSVLEKRRNFVRQRFNIDTTDLYRPIQKSIDGWLNVSDLSVINDGFEADKSSDKFFNVFNDTYLKELDETLRQLAGTSTDQT
eukprot:Skav211995  [mRNA]  locus=scaffold2069:129664:131544:- [translate_table: standard]